MLSKLPTETAPPAPAYRAAACGRGPEAAAARAAAASRQVALCTGQAARWHAALQYLAPRQRLQMEAAPGRAHWGAAQAVVAAAAAAAAAVLPRARPPATPGASTETGSTTTELGAPREKPAPNVPAPIALRAALSKV